MPNNPPDQINTEPRFTWVPFFQEISRKLLDFEDRQEELIAVLQNVGISEGFNDKDQAGSNITLSEIDPFTFFGYFNKYGWTRRREYLANLREIWNLKTATPEDDSGIPTAQAQVLWLFAYKGRRNADTIPSFWRLFKKLHDGDMLSKLFNDMLSNDQKFPGVKHAKLTQYLYWAFPERFFPIDSQTRPYLERRDISSEFDSWEEYEQVLSQINEHLAEPYHVLSWRAWVEGNELRGSFYDPLLKFLKQAKTDNLKKQGYPSSYKELDVQLSFGVGNTAKVPWIAFLRPPNKVSEGIYPVYLYYKQQRLLILAYGVSETTTPASSWDLPSETRTVKQWFEEELDTVPDRYGASFVKETYRLDQPLDHQKIRDDLDDIISAYEALTFVTDTLVEEEAEEYQRKRYWLIAPGEKARLWDQWQKEGIAAISWPEVGDVRDFPDRDALTEKLVEVNPDGSKLQYNTSLALWEFAKVMKPGDILITKQGRSEYLGYGVVQSEYEFYPDDPNYPHRRQVEWQKTGNWPEEVGTTVTKTLTDITKYPEYVDRLKRLIGIEQEATISANKNYWWLNANPKYWRIDDFELGEEQFYTTHNEKKNKRNRYEYFQAAQPGDLIIGYQSSPIKKVTAVFEVTRSAFVDDDDGEEKIGFTIQKFLPEPIPLDQVLAMPEMAEAEIKKNRQGSLFKLSKSEYNAILDPEFKLETEVEVYGIDDALKDLYLSEEDFKRILDTVSYKKNIVLQGPPGTGKTFIAKRLAYTHMKEKDETRVEMIQFHQSYSYEDFIQGYRPSLDGTFKLESGVFFRFCKRAQNDPNRDYFFIIDEINRGNLSKIFGELMLLIEADKRGPKFGVPLTYTPIGENKFYIPSNLYLIGTMNSADRSLAVVDYALRRRFAFIDMLPQFNDKLRIDLVNRGVDEGIVDQVIERMNSLNKFIKGDHSLGKWFQVGHSYFCNIPEKGGDDIWYEHIITHEIEPLLSEYWFDQEETARSQTSKLRG